MKRLIVLAVIGLFILYQGVYGLMGEIALKKLIPELSHSGYLITSEIANTLIGACLALYSIFRIIPVIRKKRGV